MVSTPIQIRKISDTARWAAVFRARENERSDALFRDPFAACLAGPRGFEIADAISDESHHTSWVVRTLLFDRFLASQIAEGVDVVVNLGAGLDARPYRMILPSSLTWIEVDLPEIVAYKEEILADQEPRCVVKRMGIDLRDRNARNNLINDVSDRGSKILIVTEGVLIYLTRKEVAALASEFAKYSQFRSWILEIASPSVLDTMNRTAGRALGESGASFQFGPPDGPDFFNPYGWALQRVDSVLKTAVKLQRTPLDPKLIPLIPDIRVRGQNSIPWVGVCLFKRQQPAQLRQSDIPRHEQFGSTDAQNPHPLFCASS